MAIQTIKVCLTNAGEDLETPWAFDLGPAPGPKGSRIVRLANVAFKHAKPTWGDVIVVTPRAGVPTWDRAKTPFILEDGGRRPLVIECGNFDAVSNACAELEIICERAGQRAYLAVQHDLTDRTVMRHLTRELGTKPTQLFP